MAENTILVGVDSSPAADAAADWAARDALLRHAALEVVNAYTIAPLTAGQPMVFPYDVLEATAEAAHRICDDAIKAISARYPDLEVTGTVINTRPADALLSHGRGMLLTVVGAHSRSALGHMLLGSVATEVAERGSGPVVVVPPPGADASQDGPVVVGVDGSPHAAAALGFGLQEASLRGVDLYAVQVWEDETHGYGEIYPVENTGDTQYEQAVRLLAEQLAGWEEQYPEVTVHRRVIRGRAADALEWVAKKRTAALVVVGSRGLNRFTGLLLGSTSQRLLRSTDRPVAVVRDES